MGRIQDYRNEDMDLSMTLEAAVTMYLEWGNNSWHASHRPVTSKADSSTYFVVYAWDEKPRLMLIHRNSEEARELLDVELPERLGKLFLESVSHLKAVYPLNKENCKWIEGGYSRRT